MHLLLQAASLHMSICDLELDAHLPHKHKGTAHSPCKAADPDDVNDTYKAAASMK
jgi:hypothetical protein